MRNSILATCALVAITSSLSAQKQFQALSRMALPTGKHNSFGISTGDINGDGAPEVVICNLSGAKTTELYLNDGLGNLTDVASTNLPASGRRFAGAVLFVDVDRDRDLDIVLGGRGTKTSLFLNDGKGKFTDASANMPATTESIYDLAAADLDFDGDQDLALASSSGSRGSDRVFLNDGKGKFTDITGATTGKTFPGTANGSWGVVAADLDGDVDIDLVFTSSGAAAPRIYINQSVFSTKFKDESAARFPTGSMTGGRKILAFDADGDRDIDLYFGNYNQQDRYYQNDGKGKFKDLSATNMPAGATRTYFPAVGDIDSDGDLDVVVGHWSGIPGIVNQILLNDGKGKFTDATGSRSGMASDSTTALALADIDCDGDLDAIHGNWGAKPSVAFNLHRHTYPASQATIGQKWPIEFYSRPGYATQISVVRPALAAGRFSMPILVPSLRGKLVIDPALMVMLPPQVIQKPGGKATIQIPIPNNQALKGLKFYAQGVIAHLTDVGFTNAFLETVK